jgi:hypothetical protein
MGNEELLDGGIIGFYGKVLKEGGHIEQLSWIITTCMEYRTKIEPNCEELKNDTTLSL